MNDLVKKLGKKRPSILVLGDIILDKYIKCKTRGISPEGPYPLVDVVEDDYRLGGAANTSNNIRKICPNSYVTLMGITGNDDESRMAKSMLVNEDIICNSIMSNHNHPTILKTRIVADGRSIVRFDRESKCNVDKSDYKLILSILSRIANDYQVIVVSDYNKGFIFDKLLTTIKINSKAKIIVDPKKKDFSVYNGVWAITPNIKEMSLALDRCLETMDDYKDASRTVSNKYNIENVIFTLSENGMLWYNKTNDKFNHYKSLARSVSDVCGSGDVVVSSIAACVSCGMSLSDSIHVANVAAGLNVEKFGTSTVTLKEIGEYCEQV